MNRTILLGLILLFSCSVLADELMLIFRHPSAEYYLYPNSVGVTQGGVRAEYAMKPHDPSRFSGIEQLNVVCLLNRKRQMKAIVAIGFLRNGQTVALEGRDLPGGGRWTSVGSNSAYEALWEVVMRKAGFL